MSCSIPIIFIIFNRPDTTAKVFQAIRQAQPQKLLVIADGPKADRHGEAEKCAAVRSFIDQVDWKCEVLTNYSDVNLGCRERVSSGLTWAFENVEEAIILEDDCLPSPSFFSYCQTLLEYYRHDKRVMVISGNNFQNGQQRTPYSYYFSKYNHCWGWATWRRAWKQWHFDSEKWLEFRDAGLIYSVCEDLCEAEYWTGIFDRLFLQRMPDSWSYAWTFSCWAQGGLTILPNVNLVSNIGFNENATHTFDANSFLSNMQVYDIWALSHPPFVISHQEADRYTFNYVFGGLEIRTEKTATARIRRFLRKSKDKCFRRIRKPS